MLIAASCCRCCSLVLVLVPVLVPVLRLGPMVTGASTSPQLQPQHVAISTKALCVRALMPRTAQGALTAQSTTGRGRCKEVKAAC